MKRLLNSNEERLAFLEEISKDYKNISNPISLKVLATSIPVHYPVVICLVAPAIPVYPVKVHCGDILLHQFIYPEDFEMCRGAIDVIKDIEEKCDLHLLPDDSIGMTGHDCSGSSPGHPGTEDNIQNRVIAKVRQLKKEGCKFSFLNNNEGLGPDYDGIIIKRNYSWEDIELILIEYISHTNNCPFYILRKELSDKS
jgi:hypothetical protein